jgi:beta-lactamase class D
MKITVAVCLFLGLMVSLGMPGSVMSGAKNLSSLFGDTEGAFVLYDLKNNRSIRHNEPRCRQRFSPYSTFKIPHSLIGLETGAIHDANSTMAFDRQKYPSQETWDSEPFIHWKQDHTLRSAIKYSVVWYYRELAKIIGEQHMKRYLNEFKYGNRDISGGLAGSNLFEAFWLNSSLQISADEQVDCLSQSTRWKSLKIFSFWRKRRFTS